MESAAPKMLDDKPRLVDQLVPKRGRKTKQTAEEVVRYFLAKDGSLPDNPELGEETASESEALIKAFQSKTCVIYVVMPYRAEAEVQGGSPTLVKRPLRK